MQLRSSLPRLGLLAALGVTGVGVAACGDDDKGSSKEASKPKTLAVSVDQGGKVISPKTIEGGVVTLRYTNNATSPYSLQMIRVSGNQTAADVLKVVNSESAPIPTWLTDGAGVGTVKPGATATSTQELPEGRWFLLPQSEDDKAKPQTPALDVTGGESGGALPKADATISAFDYGFNSSDLKAGNNTVEFANNGKQLHHVIAFPLLPGKTLAQAKTFLTSEDAKGQPPVDFANGVDTTVIDGGQKQVVTMDLKSGKYVLACFITDRSGGQPHANKGMVAEATVS
jgi:plastocyanin